MKKSLIGLFFVAVIYLFMTNIVGDIAEKEIKTALSNKGLSNFSIELLDYQRHFFTATAISQVQIPIDQQTTLTLNIASRIVHTPYQAVIKNSIKIADEVLAKRAEAYFKRPDWLNSEEKINLFSQLTGKLSIAAGHYQSESEQLTLAPFFVNYQVDLEDKKADAQLYWEGLKGLSYNTTVAINSVQFSSHISDYSQQSDYDYKLMVDNIEIKQTNNHSLLEKLMLSGTSQSGKTQKTIDTSNELTLDSYQFNDGIPQIFTDNRIKFALTGLYQPAFELLNSTADNAKEVENALVELVNNGAQLTLSQLNSQTPWGEVDGRFDLTLDKGAPLMEILLNPYTLLDYMSGDARLVLPIALLNEPALTEPLQIGLMSGFLTQHEGTLNFETSFVQGELIVNGQVIPL